MNYIQIISLLYWNLNISTYVVKTLCVSNIIVFYQAFITSLPDYISFALAEASFMMTDAGNRAIHVTFTSLDIKRTKRKDEYYCEKIHSSNYNVFFQIKCKIQFLLFYSLSIIILNLYLWNKKLMLQSKKFQL